MTDGIKQHNQITKNISGGKMLMWSKRGSDMTNDRYITEYNYKFL